MLQLENVWKSYTAKGVFKPVLQGVSFTFPEDRNIAIMGSNGAGKSTLLRIVAGIEDPDRGRVRRSTRVSWPLGFAGGFNGSMTGIENIRFVARLYGERPRDIVETVEQFAELGPSLKLPIRMYSSGMRARLAFGLSMAIDFRTYLVDEIIAVGDAAFKKKSRAAFRKKIGRANIIMISHQPSTVRTYCDSGLLLSKGHLHYFHDVEDLLAAYRRETLGQDMAGKKPKRPEKSASEDVAILPDPDKES